MPGKRTLCLAAAALVGVAAGLLALDPQFIVGTGGKWLRPENDYNAYLVAWNYYIRDAWRLPLFSVPSMGYPEGGSVLFNDALPLTAFASKMLHTVTGARVNPFGWWILLTYVLQAVMAARLVRAAGASSVVAATCAAALAVVSNSFVTRMGHTALSSHFLILWALALYFDCVRKERLLAMEATLLLAVTIAVNAYLFAMVLALEGVTIAALWTAGCLRAPDVRRMALGVSGVVVLALVMGYGFVLGSPSTMKAEGFGKYSWNLPTLLVPPDGIFGILRGMPRDATHGQYEGDAYVGRGALLLLALCLVTAPGRVLTSLGRHWIFCAGLLALAVFAASNRVYAGSSLVFSYPLPALAQDMGSLFRATGRFIWPLAYGLTLIPLCCLFRWWPVVAAIPITVLAAWLQIVEAAPAFRQRRAQTLQAHADLIDQPRMNAWLSAHSRVWQIPSWDCGGLVGSGRAWPSDDTNRELQLQLSASRLGVPSNSIYASRALKDCKREAAWVDRPTFEPGVLYVLGPGVARATPQLVELSRSPACVPLDWAVVCSYSWK